CLLPVARDKEGLCAVPPIPCREQARWSRRAHVRSHPRNLPKRLTSPQSPRLRFDRLSNPASCRPSLINYAHCLAFAAGNSSWGQQGNIGAQPEVFLKQLDDSLRQGCKLKVALLELTPAGQEIFGDLHLHA